MINPFGKENVEHMILKNKDLCMQILKKMDNGVNKLFQKFIIKMKIVIFIN